MNLAKPPAAYDRRDQEQMRDEIGREDKRNLKRGVAIEGTALILTSPDGSRFLLTVSNAGALSATAL